MKISSSAQSLLVSVMALPSSLVLGDVHFHAVENFNCIGVDFTLCSKGEKAVFATTVQKEFNKLYAPGHYLTNTHWASSADDYVEDQDDNNNRRQLQGSGGSGSSTGGSGCNYCTDDDAFSLESVIDDTQWALGISSTLKASGFTCYANIGDCTIALEETPETLQDIEEREATPSYVAAVSLQCDGLNFEYLTSTEKTFTAHKLTKASQHVAAEHDGSVELQDVSFVSSSSSSSSLFWFGLGGSGASQGFFQGTVVVHKDSSASTRPSQDDLDELAWHLETSLHEGPYSSLRAANDCTVNVELVLGNDNTLASSNNNHLRPQV